EHAVHAVVMPVVNGRMQASDVRLSPQLAGLVERSEHGHAVEGESEVCAQPRHREQKRDSGESQAEAITWLADRATWASEPPYGEHGQRHRDRDAERGDRIHDPRVEVGLPDDPRPEDCRGENDADCRRDPRGYLP